MRLLVVSHPCVTPVNQTFYAEVERQTGWELTLVTPASWESPYGERTAERGASFNGDLRPLPIWFSGNVPLHIYRSFFLPLLREVEPDVIYLHHEPYAAATGQVYLANRLSLQRPIGFFTWQNIEKTYPPPFQQLEQMVYRRSDFATPGSESAQAVLRSKGYSGPAPIIPAAINPDRFSGSARDAQPAPLDRTDATVVGYVGRIVEEKGLDTFLEALSMRRQLPWHFVLVGDGAFVDDLEEQARQLRLHDRVTFLGYVDHAEVPRYLSALDVAVLPSETQPNWKEQFGRIIVEALAAGTPVLGSNSGEIPHLIERTGGGRTFTEGDADACAKTMTPLLKNPSLRAQLAREGREYVLANYTHETLAERFIETIMDQS